MKIDNVSVIGLGYIGLPTAAIIASQRKKVIGVDVSREVVDTINKGEVHIVEPELDSVVHAAVARGFLVAKTEPEAADAFLIAVPTPFGEDHVPDTSYIRSACEAIAPVLKKGDLVILESTSPVGTTEKIADWLSLSRPDLTFPQTHGEDSDIRVAYCPERVLPGRVIHELVVNDRLIGGLTKKCSSAATEVYKLFVEGNCISTNARTAEMAKLTENSFRDLNIAFANELSIICDKLDINVWELIKLANRHPRVNILQPGPGVGGHCIAVDPWFIVDTTPDEAKLIRCARLVNDGKPDFVVRKIINKAEKENTKNIICLGAAFKPDIDDLRESPALMIIKKLVNSGYSVSVVEPNIEGLPDEVEKMGCKLVSLEDIYTNQDDFVVSLLVAHKEFKGSAVLNELDVLDFCGVLQEI